MYLLPPFWRGLQVAGGSIYLTSLILIAVFLWVFASVISSAPIDVLKRKLVVSAWVILPAALTYTLWLAVPGSFRKTTFMQIASMLLWTEVFAALLIGGVLRRSFFPGWQSPYSLSLPLATFVFTIIAAATLYLFIEYGTFQKPSNCGPGPHSPLSVCGYFNYEGFYFGSALFLILVCIGIALPADSNLTRANDRLGLLVRTACCRALAAYRKRRLYRAEQREDEKSMALTDPASYPVPAIIDAFPVEAMRLKLRRSQRSRFMGKMYFALDARIELTAEERSLVEKYHLGDSVIYESTSRERHRNAMMAHAESTRDQPGLLDSPKDQLLGLGKTLFRVARAGASATAAALSLRVTVYSLMRGVHIECKSMNELLGAENAIVEAAQNLKAHLQTAMTFDGREEIIDL